MCIHPSACVVALSVPHPCNHQPHQHQAFVRDCSEVSPYALLLAARTLKQAHTTSHHHEGDTDHAGTLLLDEDGWVRFAAVGRIGALVAALKRRVDALLGAFAFCVLSFVFWRMENGEWRMTDWPAAEHRSSRPTMY